jgi:hypothetical protein
MGPFHGLKFLCDKNPHHCVVRVSFVGKEAEHYLLAILIRKNKL